MNKFIKLASGVVSGSVAGKSLAEDELKFLQAYKPIGLTVFSRNIDDRDYESFTQLAQSIQSCYSHPIGALIKVDQEGGRVRRFKSPFPNLGPAMHMCEGPNGMDIECIRHYGQLVGAELARLGVHINFAPVVDILTNPQNDAIGDRCFGHTSEAVVRKAEAFLFGMQQSPVLGCLKHFPGQGDASIDTHVSKAEINIAYGQLMDREVEPFRKLLSQTSMVMISHCIYPALDPETPASLSSRVQEGLLRQKMGFEGVIVSDDMTMGAISQDLSVWKKSMIESINAGTDMLLICSGLDRWKEAIHAIAEMAQASSAFADRLCIAFEKNQWLLEKIRSRSIVCPAVVASSQRPDRIPGS